jgi:hypothetical protein
MNLDAYQFTNEGIECTINPTNFLQSIERRKKKESYINWLSQFSEGFFEMFVIDGLIPFITAHKYKFAFSEEILIKNIKHWSWAHYYCNKYKSQHLDIILNISNNDEYVSEYECFLNIIDDTILETFIKSWATDDFLDINSQINDFYSFVWLHIDIFGSPAYQKWLDSLPEDSDDEVTADNNYNNDNKSKWDL